MKNLTINSDPYFFKQVNNHELAEHYIRNIYMSIHKKNLSFLGIFTGQHRVGKSVGGCAFADILDPTFIEHFEERIVYHPDDFMNAFDMIREDKIKGGAVVFDETQIKHGSRDWYTTMNKTVNSVIQSYGYLNPVTFFIVQDPSFIDSQPRKLFHAFYEVFRSDNKQSFILPFNIKYNRRTGKPYYVYPRVRVGYYGSMGYRVKMNLLSVQKPFDDFIERYNNHSQDFKNKFLKNAHELAKSIREEEEYKHEDLSDYEIVDDLLQRHFDDPIFLNRNGDYRVEEIRNEYKISFRHAKRIQIRASIKRKEMMQKVKK